MFWITWCVGWCMHILTLFLKKLENFPVWFYLTVSSVYIQESPSLRLNSIDHQQCPLKHRSLSIIPLHHGLKNVPSSLVWGLTQPELNSSLLISIFQLNTNRSHGIVWPLLCTALLLQLFFCITFAVIPLLFYFPQKY